MRGVKQTLLIKKLGVNQKVLEWFVGFSEDEPIIIGCSGGKTTFFSIRLEHIADLA